MTFILLRSLGNLDIKPRLVTASSIVNVYFYAGLRLQELTFKYESSFNRVIMFVQDRLSKYSFEK